jgi:hypothetical protein
MSDRVILTGIDYDNLYGKIARSCQVHFERRRRSKAKSYIAGRTVLKEAGCNLSA